ncbi:hypothetical protein GMES_4085 [Paraglaciecola mesophila KMM 241]|uniref:Uncharacterized protein n=1 Tax=Paraglaciecola mesophila KMM 241 TaxID=1128912 RepID=K6ZBM0_9ALTE|nr:hypothetical protein GMES_4085 [Paraglaciecola mesophila KMM 241]
MRLYHGKIYTDFSVLSSFKSFNLHNIMIFNNYLSGVGFALLFATNSLLQNNTLL